MPTKTTFSKNLQYYAVDWDSFEVQQYPIHDNTKQYVEALLPAYYLNMILHGTEAWAGTTFCSPSPRT